MEMVLERAEKTGAGPLVLHPLPEWESKDHFERLCAANPDLCIERTAQGDLVIMPPTGGSTGHANIELAFLFQQWARNEQSGRAFDSSTGFVLPNGAIRSADISWVRNERLKQIKDSDWDQFLPLAPDFVLELRSHSDRLKTLQTKLDEYIANGTRMGWLIDPIEKRVHVYRPNRRPEVMDNPESVSGETVLNGFELRLAAVWTAVEKPR